MLEQIIKEKTSADHLLYVSLKYTKTCDVILNLIKRWGFMIGACVDGLLAQAKKNKKLKIIPAAPRQKIELVKKTFKNSPEIIKVMSLYDFFKRVDNLPKKREFEFRKNVRLVVTDEGKEIIIDLEKLKEYSKEIDIFIESIKKYLA